MVDSLVPMLKAKLSGVERGGVTVEVVEIGRSMSGDGFVNGPKKSDGSIVGRLSGVAPFGKKENLCFFPGVRKLFFLDSGY